MVFIGFLRVSCGFLVLFIGFLSGFLVVFIGFLMVS